MRVPFIVALLVLAACDGPAGEEREVSSGRENGVEVRVTRLGDGLYRASTRSVGDTRNPADVVLHASTSAAGSAVGPFCTNGYDRLPGDEMTGGEQVGPTTRAYSGRFRFRCRPDSRSAAELEALRQAPRTRPHPCGLLFDERGGITGSAPC